MRNSYVRIIVGIGLFTAVVVVLQLLGAFIHFGPFSISLVLVPIVVGGALYGVGAGAWLGAVFGLVVLLSGDAAAFLAVNIPGTIITVMAKGTLAGLLSALVFNLFKKAGHKPENDSLSEAKPKSGFIKYLGVILAAIVAPVTNTGIFLLGCKIFFMDQVTEWSKAAGFESAGAYMIIGFVGINFVIELAVNVILSPVIVKIVDLGTKSLKRS